MSASLVLGDFNAFEFNDGYADVMGTVTGVPCIDDTTAVAGDGADLVNPDLSNLASFEQAGERYSYVFEGNAQSLDHVLANQALLDNVGVGFDHARINADFPENARSDGASPSRLSDHDPLLAYFSLDSADLSVVATPRRARCCRGAPWASTWSCQRRADAPPRSRAWASRSMPNCRTWCSTHPQAGRATRRRSPPARRSRPARPAAWPIRLG